MQTARTTWRLNFEMEFSPRSLRSYFGAKWNATKSISRQDIRVIRTRSKNSTRRASAVRGSRQERINPDQLLLFSQEEFKHLEQELEKSAADNASEPDQPQRPDQPSEQPQDHTQDPATPEEPAKKKVGRRSVPAHWSKEILRHDLSEEERKCPCCGKTRHEMGVEASPQIEFIPSVAKIVEHQRVPYACKGLPRERCHCSQAATTDRKRFASPRALCICCLIQIR